MGRRTLAGGVRLGVLLAAAVLLAGCFGSGSSPIRVVPYVVLTDAEPGRETTLALFLESTSPFKQVLGVGVDDLPEGWRFEPEVGEVTIPGRATSSLLVRVAPDANATDGPRTLRVKVGDTRADVLVNVRTLGERPLADGMTAEAHVARFLANGTLAWTNWKVVADQAGAAGIPRAAETANATADAGEAWQPRVVHLGNASAEDEALARLLLGMVEDETRGTRATIEGVDVGMLVRVVEVDG